MTPEIRLNGVRYCWPDRPVVVVCNDGEAHDGRALLRVCDQGPVIGQRERTGLFLPFHRVAGASGSQGTGLGLALVRQIARRHGGDVAYEAEPSWRNGGTDSALRQNLRHGEIARWPVS